MFADIYEERKIPVKFAGFSLEMVAKIVKKFKFQVTDYELLKRRLNSCYSMYVNGTWMFKNQKRPAERVRYKKLCVYHTEKLIAIINDTDFYTGAFFQAPTQTQEGLNLKKLVNDLELLLYRAKQYLPHQCNDKGGRNEKDRAFNDLIKCLIREYQLHSRLKPKIGWYEKKEDYQGEVYNFIKYYLRITKIPIPFKDLGKYISRAISGKRAKVVSK